MLNQGNVGPNTTPNYAVAFGNWLSAITALHDESSCSLLVRHFLVISDVTAGLEAGTLLNSSCF